MSQRKYFDIPSGRLGADPGIAFPGWDLCSESVAVLSPHDDDALLGAGYLIDAMLELGVPVSVVIFCQGDAGYSDAALRETIVQLRKQETLEAYRALGLPDEAVIRLDRPDFSLRRQVAWDGLGKENGLFGELIRLLRRLKVTRLLVANGHREHVDHTAVYDSGLFDGVQAADPVLADFGPAAPLRSTHVYSVWADFSPEDALTQGRENGLRANAGLTVGAEVEARIVEALRCYRSQINIIEGLVDMRQAKRADAGFIELYQWIDPRPKLDYAPYVNWLNGRS